MEESLARYQNLLDDRLADLLGSFTEYDFDSKALFNQREFERQLYPLIEPLMKKPEESRYSLVFELFMNIFKMTCNPPKQSHLMGDFKSQYNKFITLIDICVLISRSQADGFAKFPLDVAENLVKFDLFDEVEDVLAKYGRINYKFPMKKLREKRREYVKDHPDPNRMRRKKKKKGTRSTAVLLDELTEKLMSKQPSKKNAKHELKKEEPEGIADDESEPSSDDVSSDDDFQDAKEDIISAPITTSARSRGKQHSAIEKTEEDPLEDDAPSAGDLSDESEHEEETEQGIMNRTTIKLHRNTGKGRGTTNKGELAHSTSTSNKVKREEGTSRRSKKRKAALASANSKKNCVLSKNRFLRNWRVVNEPNFDFLYSKLESRFEDLEPYQEKPACNGFVYKPPQFTLFEKLVVEHFKEAELKSLDTLINSFLLQSYKRAGGCVNDDVMFLHPLEYSYIQENMAKFRESTAEPLPPLLFGNRWQSLFNENGYTTDGVKKLNIKATKVKDIWLLKPFATEEQYWETFPKIVPRKQVAKRIDFLNTIIADGNNNLYICDDLERINSFIIQNEYLMDVSETEDDPLKLEDEDVDFAEDQFETQPTTASIATKLLESKSEASDAPAAEVTIAAPVRETDDDRSTVISTLRGVWVSCKSLRRILAPKDQFKVLANFLFPALSPQKEYPGVPQRAISDLCEVYSGFRPYLLSLFIDDIYGFYTMPLYFRLDSTMFELQVQDYFSKKKNKAVTSAI